MKTTQKKDLGRQVPSTTPQQESQQEVHRPKDENREKLKQLSNQVKHLVQEGKFSTMNEAILATFYQNEHNTEFRSFLNWSQNGYQIKKGEKAFLLWGKPKEHHVVNKDDPEKEDTDYSFYPIAKVFSNNQVVTRDKTAVREDLTKLRQDDTNRNQEMER